MSNAKKAFKYAIYWIYCNLLFFIRSLWHCAFVWLISCQFNCIYYAGKLKANEEIFINLSLYSAVLIFIWYHSEFQFCIKFAAGWLIFTFQFSFISIYFNQLSAKNFFQLINVEWSFNQFNWIDSSFIFSWNN